MGRGLSIWYEDLFFDGSSPSKNNDDERSQKKQIDRDNFQKETERNNT